MNMLRVQLQSMVLEVAFSRDEEQPSQVLQVRRNCADIWRASGRSRVLVWRYRDRDRDSVLSLRAPGKGKASVFVSLVDHGIGGHVSILLCLPEKFKYKVNCGIIAA